MKTTTEKQVIEKQRKRHHDALQYLYIIMGPHPGKIAPSGLALWRKLRRLEQIAHRIATAYCNGETTTYNIGGTVGEFNPNDETSWEAFVGLVQLEVATILGAVPRGFFVNGDARGYALKIHPALDGVDLEQDWGSNQILAPEIN